MNIQEAYDLAIQLEDRMSECYSEMSKLYQYESLSEEFINFSKEEKAHVNLLLNSKNYVSETPEEFELDPTRWTEIEYILDQVIDLINKVEGKLIRLEEALNDTVEMERIAEQFHLKTVTEVKNPSLKKLFETLSQGKKAHRERLIRILTSLSARAYQE